MNYTRVEVTNAIESLKRRAVNLRELSLESPFPSNREDFAKNILLIEARIQELHEMLVTMGDVVMAADAAVGMNLEDMY